MSNTQDQNKYTRVTADFNADAYRVLEEVAHVLHTNKADAIRRSLGLIHYILSEKKKGRKIFSESQDGKEREVIVSI